MNIDTQKLAKEIFETTRDAPKTLSIATLLQEINTLIQRISMAKERVRTDFALLKKMDLPANILSILEGLEKEAKEEGIL